MRSKVIKLEDWEEIYEEQLKIINEGIEIYKKELKKDVKLDYSNAVIRHSAFWDRYISNKKLLEKLNKRIKKMSEPYNEKDYSDVQRIIHITMKQLDHDIEYLLDELQPINELLEREKIISNGYMIKTLESKKEFLMYLLLKIRELEETTG